MGEYLYRESLVDQLSKHKINLSPNPYSKESLLNNYKIKKHVAQQPPKIEPKHIKRETLK
jgi:hypothetical protein